MGKMRDQSIACIGRFRVLWPILNLARKVWTRLVAKVVGHIDRFLVGQTSLTEWEFAVEADRHVALDEGGGGIGPGHAGADIEGLITP